MFELFSAGAITPGNFIRNSIGCVCRLWEDNFRYHCILIVFVPFFVRSIFRRTVFIVFHISTLLSEIVFAGNLEDMQKKPGL